MKLKQMIRQLDLSKEEKLNRVLIILQSTTENIEEQLIGKHKVELSHRELIYLVFIHDCSGMNMMDIGEVMGLSKGAFSKAVKSLVERKFVKKTRSKRDTRVSTLSLTKKGNDAYEIHREARNAINKVLREKIFNEEEMDMLYKIAAKYIDSDH